MAERGTPKKSERILELAVYNSRWLVAPFYVGLILSIVVLFVHFAMQFYALAARVFTVEETEIVLGILSLIDLTLTANLLLIVIFSGYENFVSRIDVAIDDRPGWMTKIDFGGLKQKLMASIVAISAVQVLKGFVNIEHYDATKMAWIVGIHLVFLLSLLIVVIADRIGEGSEHPSESRNTAAKKT